MFDNELAIPLRVGTATQADPAEIAPGGKGWLYCDGTGVDHVFDVAAAVAAAASPLAVRGDLYVRDGTGNARLPLGAAAKVLGSDGTDPKWLLPPGRPNARARYLANDFVARDGDDTLIPGGTAVSLTATLRLGNLITNAVTFPDHANLGIWDADSQSCMTSINRGMAVAFQDGGLSVWGNANSGRNGDPNGSHWPHFQPALYRTTNEGHQRLGGRGLLSVRAMTASVVIVTNPFEPVASRTVHAVEAGLTVGALLLDCGIGEDRWDDGPEIRIGGSSVPPEVFTVHLIGEGDIVSVIRWPMGGGGGKNPLRVVLTIAVMVAAIYLGPMAAVATAGIAIVGSVLINTVIPAPKPSMPSLNWGGSGVIAHQGGETGCAMTRNMSQPMYEDADPLPPERGREGRAAAGAGGADRAHGGAHIGA